MDCKIIADSCCDLTPELRERLGGAVSVPLIMTLGEKSFVDDDALDLPNFMAEMKACTERIGSASPSPSLYKDAFVEAKTSFAVTLSSNLSGSYSSAMIGKTLAEEEGAEVHVFDSKSATAGEVLIALKIREMINNQFQKVKIIASIDNFIRDMKTYFVLDNVDNLRKNGRLNKITATIVSVLNIRPIMGADGDGHIAMFAFGRGEKQILQRLADFIEESGKTTEGESMVITHCNNPGLAEKLMNLIKNRYNFSEILIVPTRGLSSMYANNKGIVMAF